MDTHEIRKALTDAGVDERQAAVIADAVTRQAPRLPSGGWVGIFSLGIALGGVLIGVVTWAYGVNAKFAHVHGKLDVLISRTTEHQPLSEHEGMAWTSNCNACHASRPPGASGVAQPAIPGTESFLAEVERLRNETRP